MLSYLNFFDAFSQFRSAIRLRGRGLFKDLLVGRECLSLALQSLLEVIELASRK